jgi:hypothetical protein
MVGCAKRDLQQIPVRIESGSRVRARAGGEVGAHGSRIGVAAMGREGESAPDLRLWMEMTEVVFPNTHGLCFSASIEAKTLFSFVEMFFLFGLSFFNKCNV